MRQHQALGSASNAVSSQLLGHATHVSFWCDLELLQVERPSTRAQTHLCDHVVVVRNVTVAVQHSGQHLACTPTTTTSVAVSGLYSEWLPPPPPQCSLTNGLQAALCILVLLARRCSSRPQVLRRWLGASQVQQRNLAQASHKASRVNGFHKNRGQQVRGWRPWVAEHEAHNTQCERE